MAVMTMNNAFGRELTSLLLDPDTGILADCELVSVALINEPFDAADPTLDLGALSRATFTGSAAKAGGGGAAQLFLDPLTATWYLRIVEPAGGFVWICTAAPVSPETIYGLVATQTDSAFAMGAASIPPTLISVSGDGIDPGNVVFQLAGITLAPLYMGQTEHSARPFA
jgi:hypothetical protein